MTWLTGIGAKVWAYLAAILAGIAVVFGFYHTAKKAGILHEREKRDADEIKRIDGEAVRKVEQAQEVAAVQADKVGAANEVLNDVINLGDGDAAKQLQNEWARD